MKLARSLALVLLSVACSRTTPSVVASNASWSATAVFPGADWDSVGNPKLAGYSAAGLEQVRAALAKTPTTGFVAVVGGKVLMTYGDVDSVSYLASVRKSVLAALMGNYVKSGTIDLNKSLAQLGFDDVGGLLPIEKEATIRDLLMARSGVYHPASNAGDDLASAPPRGSQKHGTYFLYNNWDFNALGAAFEHETGRNIYDALESDIARPIGMQDFTRAAQRKSGDTTASRFLAYHIYLSTRDMARFGYLMLREGDWAGKQLIPRDWLHTITSIQTAVPEMHPASHLKGPWGYGYLWWVWDKPWNAGPYEGAYTGLGAVGQHITVLPKLDLVVAHKTAPGRNGSVSHEQFAQILDILVKAHCGGSCP